MSFFFIIILCNLINKKKIYLFNEIEEKKIEAKLLKNEIYLYQCFLNIAIENKLIQLLLIKIEIFGGKLLIVLHCIS